MIRIENLQVQKSGRIICRVEQLAVASGQRIAVLGANGAGKSTLLRVLSGLELDYTGTCQIEAGTRDRVLVHQTPYLFRGSVLFNVCYGLRARGIPNRDAQQLAFRWLERFKIAHLAQSSVSNLSGGERRRVALSRAFVLAPRLVLLDEPFSDLDSIGIETLVEELTASEALEEATIVLCAPLLPATGLDVDTVELQQAQGD